MFGELVGEVAQIIINQPKLAMVVVAVALLSNWLMWAHLALPKLLSAA
jgi:hypothetical protein